MAKKKSKAKKRAKKLKKQQAIKKKQNKNNVPSSVNTNKNVSKKKNGDLKKKSSNSKSKNKIVLKKKIDIGSSLSPKRFGALRHKYGKFFVKVNKPFRFVFKFFAVLFILFVIFIGSVLYIFGRDLPDVTKLKDLQLDETSVIYDREGNVLYSVFKDQTQNDDKISYPQ